MPYETPITIRQALERMDTDQYLLPAIQREFVWSPIQITKLFDSLMRGYPIGGFLLWRLKPEMVEEVDLYRFLKRFSEYDSRHNERHDALDKGELYAVLDGQQRLTALNIGLRGSYAYRLPRKWAHKPENYPARMLHLELCRPETSGDTDADTYAYRFEFLRQGEAQQRNSATEHWFPVPQALETTNVVKAMPAFQAAGLTDSPLGEAMETLQRLIELVGSDLTIAAHVEEDQDLDRVLDIFIRVNSGGTALSSSDLLLSIATARWKQRDARETIHALVDELNGVGGGFAFNKNQVLKAALVLSDASDVQFKASNINPTTMARVEECWDEIEAALKLAAATLSHFGFAQQSLAAHSVLIPLADWHHQRKHDQSWLTKSQWQDDRQAVRSWVLRSLLKRGTWGSGLDTLLVAMRRAMRESDGLAFPVVAIEKSMAARGKSLTFTDEEIDGLTWTEYGRNAFAVLAALYPGWDATKAFHVDHVFPKKRLTKKALLAAGLDLAAAQEAEEIRDCLPNLQLLEGSVNTSKQAKLPAEWVDAHHLDEASQQAYLAGHDLAGLPEGTDGFCVFFEQRRQRMLARLRQALGTSAVLPSSADDDAALPDDELSGH